MPTDEYNLGGLQIIGFDAQFENCGVLIFNGISGINEKCHYGYGILLSYYLNTITKVQLENDVWLFL